MKKFSLLILLLTPLAAHAQLSAVNPDVTKPTRHLTGRTDSVFVFFDTTAATLTGRNPDGTSTDFTWFFLNPVDTSFTKIHTQTGVVSSCTITKPGGYQVALNNAARDTFTCWIFFDDFRIDTIIAANTCTELRLDMVSTPSIYYTGYTIYNFQQFLDPPHIGDSTYYGVQEMQWSSSANIHERVAQPDESWKTRRTPYTFIDSPPPLKESSYTLVVRDVFGKSASYTTPYTVSAIAAYAKISAQELVDNMWQTPAEPPKGEALYQIKFSQEESINADKFHWKGFGNENIQGAGRQVMWENSTATPTDWITPTMWYKKAPVPGYLPGKYTVRLIARNTTCADSVEIRGIEVSPSKFAVEAIPNAFTPNGDGQNDIFRFVKGNEPVSMENIKIYIYSRSGMLVYRYEGRADAWEGWDGRMMGNRGQVADGLYYYIFSGEGWDEVQYNSSAYKGALHIFR